MVKLTIKGGIEIPKKEISDFLLNTIKGMLTYPNPFDEENDLKGFRETKNMLYVPRNFEKELRKLIPDSKLKPDMINAPTSFELNDEFCLRDYQVNAKTKLMNILSKDHSALLTAETGAGKSYSITAVVQALKQRTLILAHLTMLTHQLKIEMGANSTANIVEITSKTTEQDIMDADILIGTFALLHQNRKLVTILSKHIGTLVIDETENMLSETRLDIVFLLNPSYSIFMSATPSRELLQQTPLLNYFISQNVVKMSVPKEYVITPKVIMLNYTRFDWHSPTNQNWYKKMLWFFLKDSKIALDTCKLVKHYYDTYKGCQWVISDLTRAHKYLKENLIKQGIDEEAIKIISGSTSKKERQRILEGISDGSIKVVLGSAPLSAGVSIPNLNIAYRLIPHSSSDELLTQQIGRLKRYADFKKKYPPLFLDYAIEGSLAYKGKRRYKMYQRTFDTTFIRTEDILNS